MQHARSLAILWLLVSIGAWLRAEEAAITATASTGVHPVLIGNDQNELLEVVVTVKPGELVDLRAIRFALEVTDDVEDVESLDLYAAGKTTAFAPGVRFGGTEAPARIVEFQGQRALQPGANRFWLSCRLKPGADLAHRVGATCTWVETSAGIFSAVHPSGKRSHHIGVAVRKHGDAGVHTYRIPVLATTRAGTLLCAYDMRRKSSKDLQGDIDIGLSRSSDGGRSWEPARVIMDMGTYNWLPEDQNGCSDPGMVVDQKTGEIFCFAVWMNGKPGKHQWTGDGSEAGFEIGKSAQLLVVKSRDDGKTWTKPENLTRALKKPEWWLLAPSPQQGIHLSDGTLVMPVQGRDSLGRRFSTVMSSQDHGATWTVGAPAALGCSECQAAQLGDGAIMLNMRNDNERFRAVSITRDLGRTWREHETSRKTLIEPTCNASLLRVALAVGGGIGGITGRGFTIFANPHSQTGRTHQTIQVSFDDGRTWPSSHHLLLDEGRGSGYASLTNGYRVRPGAVDIDVCIVYEGSQADLVFEKFGLDELRRSIPLAPIKCPVCEP